MTDEEFKKILNGPKNFVKINNARIIQTKKKINKIEQEVIELHRKMILLL